MGMLTKRLAKTVMGLALAAAMTGTVSAQELLKQADAGTALHQLMEPITPLLPGAASNTTNISQIGEGNYASSSVTGAGSLSLIEQSGSNNRAIQSIQGSNSAMLLVQGGTNNNVLQASRGDNNFQLVDVSGHNNNVAYVQSGNELAGALDVRDSKNSTVVALQTPQSGRYLMPTGLSGLHNTTVVIVPGRMYVIPKK